MPNTPSPCAMVWFREDLRLGDNPALAAAAATGLPLLCVFVCDDASQGLRPCGAAARWRLDRGLEALEADLARFHGRLHFLRGASDAVLPKLARAAHATRVCFSRRHGGAEREIDARVAARLKEAGAEVASFNASLLVEPEQLGPRPGGYFKVFTPFWRAVRERLLHAEPTPPAGPGVRALAVRRRAAHPFRPEASAGASRLGQRFSGPRRGRSRARQRLRDFIEQRLEGYETMRDRIDCDGASRLSAHLHFGEISPRQIVAALRGRPAEKFLIELCWREFSTHLLHARPELPWVNFNARFDHFPYRDDPEGLEAWKRGRTGYPIVDAAMRQLWRTGFMANRARMVAPAVLLANSLLTGARRRGLVLGHASRRRSANNAVSWQWVAGHGPDAAPFFRIFNPVLQGEKFDPEGEFVKTFCPELARLPARYIHRPWSAPADVLEEAGVAIGRDWPAPIVDHDFARRRALDAFGAIAAAGH